MNVKKLFLLSIATLTLLLFSACATDSGSDATTSPAETSAEETPVMEPTTMSIDFSIRFPEQENSFLGKALGTFGEVASVTVTVTEGATTHATADLELSVGGVWVGTIDDLPVGTSLTFTASAKNGASLEIFTGATTGTIEPGGSAIEIALDSVDDTVANIFPSITQIQRPAEVGRTQTSNLVFDFKGNADEAMNWAITPAAGDPGSFTTGSGSITTTGSGVASQTDTFTAPTAADSVGTYIHSIKLTNSQGNWVKNQFDIEVVHGTATGDITTKFSPVVTALGGERSLSPNTEITWEVTADDGAGSVVSYVWSYTDGTGGTGDSLAFDTPIDNTVVMTGYENPSDTSGVITLVITDNDDLETTVEYQLALNQFPDGVVISN